MPTYEYECKKCGHNFEVFQSMSDEPLKNCTQCGGEVRRLIFGGAGVIFKGSGFYVTDKVADKASGKSKTPSGGGASSDAKTKTAKTASETTSGTTPGTSAPTTADTPKAEAKPAVKTA
jgi:putative FmdB family regulatory protein